MVHIQSCAKKNAFTDDTVKILIRREVDKITTESQAVNAKGKGKASDPENLLPEAPRTYMADVVHATEPKSRRRRPDVETLKNGMETREEILDRARVILGNNVLPDTQNLGFQAQGFKSSRLVDQLGRNGYHEAPAAQAFGEGALRERQTPDVASWGVVRKYSTFDAEPIGYEEGSMPPSTQNFAPSKLGGLRGISSSSAFDAQHNIDSDPPSHHLQPLVKLNSSLSPQSPRPVRIFVST
jgi:hypothetical protein